MNNSPLRHIIKAGLLASIQELGAYLRVGYDAAHAEARRRQTITYRLKTELVNNAAAAAAGVEALRTYDPDAELRQAKQTYLEGQ